MGRRHNFQEPLSDELLPVCSLGVRSLADCHLAGTWGARRPARRARRRASRHPAVNAGNSGDAGRQRAPRDAAQRIARRDRARHVGTRRQHPAYLPRRRLPDPEGVPGHRARAGAHDVPGQPGIDRRAIERIERQDGRREQRIHDQRRHAVFVLRARGLPRHAAPHRGRPHARRIAERPRLEPRKGCDRAGSLGGHLRPGLRGVRAGRAHSLCRHRLRGGSAWNSAIFRQDDLEDAARVLRYLVSAEQCDLRDRRRRRPADDACPCRGAVRHDPHPSDPGAQARGPHAVQGADHGAHHAGGHRLGTVPLPDAGADVQGQCGGAGAPRRAQQSAERAVRARRAGQGPERRCGHPALQSGWHRADRGRLFQGHRSARSPGASRRSDRRAGEEWRIAGPGRRGQALRARTIRIQQEQRGEPCERMVAGTRVAGSTVAGRGAAADPARHGRTTSIASRATCCARMRASRSC